MKYTLILLVCASLLGGCEKKSDNITPGYITLGWKELLELDVNTGKKSALLTEADNKKVKIAGFVTPLSDDAKEVFEFTLVPYPVSCIHTPPPPPNQIVVVTLQNQHLDPADLWRPFWVYGTLKIDTTKNSFFTASYTMEAEHIDKYE